MKALTDWKKHIKQLQVEAYSLYLAYKDPRVPRHARLFTACVVGYAFSPLDLIPDSIPILGYLDDLILVPLGIVLALKMIPEPVQAECRARAQAHMNQAKPAHRVAAAATVVIWLMAATLTVSIIFRLVRLPTS
jgi:uncharacterized membrane protein YkvA (DUF1232 family)